MVLDLNDCRDVLVSTRDGGVFAFRCECSRSGLTRRGPRAWPEAHVLLFSSFDLSHMHVGGSACDSERRDEFFYFHVGSRLDI